MALLQKSATHNTSILLPEKLMLLGLTALILRRGDSWPTMVPSVVPTGDCSYRSIHYIHQPNRPISVWMGKVPTRKHAKWHNRTSDREPDSRFWIGKPGFLFEFPSNHMSILLSFGDIRVWQTDGRTTQTITIAGPNIVVGQLIRKKHKHECMTHMTEL